MEERSDIVIYKSEDGLVTMEAMVDPAGETIWATQKAIAALFGKDVSDISRHIRNVYTRGELTEESTLQKMQIAFSDKPVQYYNLDMIISVGYRVNSVRATRFRIWATDIMRMPLESAPSALISSGFRTRIVSAQYCRYTIGFCQCTIDANG